MPAPDPLLVIAGPTASGKSDTAVIVAEKLQTEIISADSVQIYRHFDIGSAKPSATLLKRVRHHMIDVADPEEEFNVASYRDMAGQIARNLWSAGSLPLVVGGSGLYIKGLAEGLDCAVRISDEVNKKLEALFSGKGQKVMYDMMREVDPAWALKVHPNDTFRTRRALGVYMTEGKTMSQIFSGGSPQPQHQGEGDRPKWDALVMVIDLPRKALYNRIENRVEKMWSDGWPDEVMKLREMGYNTRTKPMKSIGYRTVYKKSAGLIDTETAKKEIVKDTKAFAKRQLTWLRKVDRAVFVPINIENTPGQIAEKIFCRDETRGFFARHDIHI